MSSKPATPSPSAEVVWLARNEGKIAAIKRYRAETGAGLAAARAAVDLIPDDAEALQPVRQQNKRSVKSALMLVGLLLGGCGTIFTAKNIVLALNTVQWSSTEGFVNDVRLLHGYRSKKMVVSYEYEVDGQRYESDRVGFTQIYGNYYNRKLANQYAPGMRLEVYYDPDNPAKAVLERRVLKGYWLAFGVCLALLLFGLTTYRAALRAERLLAS